MLFVVLLAAVVFADRRVPVTAGSHPEPAPASRLASRLAPGLAVAAAVVGVVVTALVVWIGHVGAASVWS